MTPASFVGAIRRLAALLAVLFAVSSCGLTDEPVALTPEDRTAACEFARATLSGRPGATDGGTLPARLGEPREREVFVTVYRQNGARIERGFRGASIGASLSAAADAVRRSPEWTANGFAAALGDPDGEPLAIQIDIVTARGAVPIRHREISRHWFTPGLDGGYLASGDTAYYLLPAALLQRGVPASEIAAQLEQRQGIPIDRPARAPRGFFRFRTTAFVQHAAGAPAVPLYRGNVLVPPVDASALRAACVLGGECLLRLLKDDGRFHYWYDPATDQFGARTGEAYNLLRHAGTTYALFQLYAETRHDAFRAGGESALGWLRSKVRESDDGRLAYPAERRTVKLGGAGLALLAFLERARATGVRDDDARIEKLGAFLVSQQEADGSFRNYYSLDPKRPAPRRQSIYYPGEAILALTRLHAYDGNTRWLDAAARGADYLVGKRWSILGIDVVVPPDAWLLMALAELHRARPDARRDAYALRIARGMIADQIGEGDPFPDFVGGYAPRPPNVTPAGSRMEGLTAAYGLARDLGLPTGDILRAIRLAARFQVNCQVRPETASFFVRPLRALGAFRESPVATAMRIDYNQHNVSGLLAAARIVEAVDASGAAAR
jgi:hypothetical protein